MGAELDDILTPKNGRLLPPEDAFNQGQLVYSAEINDFHETN